jgi:hypothetical protein
MSDLVFEVIQLRAEVKLLRAEVADVRNALKFESDSTTGFINKIYQAISDIDDRLYPVLHKVFPDLAPMQAAVDDCMKPPTGN